MDQEMILHRATMMTPEGFKEGSLVIREGLISDLSFATDADHKAFIRRLNGNAVDFQGDLLLPGLVETHTDNIEKHLKPRPGIYWPEVGAAMEAHDAQLISCGITTVFDSICVGETVDQGREVLLQMSIRALDETIDHLRADHKIHLRCEVGASEMSKLFASVCAHPAVALLSIMDHTPGERQWRDLDSYRRYWERKEFENDLEAHIEKVRSIRDECVKLNTEQVVFFSSLKGLPLASHDDTTAQHIDEAVKNGATISEFPTTIEAARTARESGMAVTMGAPNLLRGGSHSGNISAKQVALEGLLSCLSSDYVPSSLLSGAFILNRDCGFSLYEAIKTVTENPAKVGGLNDRGRLEPGLRADLVRVKTSSARPLVKSVWVKGQKVF
jgi:alpha-D-ribose 1-methylphosphonate 5-triphosphate diphosphatase